MMSHMSQVRPIISPISVIEITFVGCTDCLPQWIDEVYRALWSSGYRLPRQSVVDFRGSLQIYLVTGRARGSFEHL